ncbi:MAG: septum formation initiator family protein [Oscillospiraceae bacterium]|nr:septum formation initiator family protein [Oscillospiraceae bacterium]
MSSKVQSGQSGNRRGQRQPRSAKRETFIPYFIFLLIVGYAVFLLISTQVEIQEKRGEYEALSARLTEVRAANEQLERYLRSEEYLAEYMEMIARGKLSYAHPRERIYYILPSS